MQRTGHHAAISATGPHAAISATGRLVPMASAPSARARMVIALPARSVVLAVMLANAAKVAAALAASRPAEAGLGEAGLDVAGLDVAHRTEAATSRAGHASRSSDGGAHADRRR